MKINNVVCVLVLVVCSSALSYAYEPILYGLNFNGELGTGYKTNSSVDPFVLNVCDGCQVKYLYVGTYVSVAITSDNVIWIAGDVAYGTSANANHLVFSRIASPNSLDGKSITGVYEISNGLYFLTSTGAVYAMGAGTSIGLSSGRSSDVQTYTTPTKILDKKNITSMATSYFTVALDSGANAVYTWGDNRQGQIFYGASSFIPYPTVQNTSSIGSRTIVSVYATISSTFLLCSDNTLWSQGSDYTGFSASTNKYTLLARSVESVSVGGSHAIIRYISGSISIFGDNTYGQLCAPSSTTSQIDTPSPITNMGDAANKKISRVVASFLVTYLIDSDGVTYGCGINNKYEITNAYTGNVYTPTKLQLKLPSGYHSPLYPNAHGGYAQPYVWAYQGCMPACAKGYTCNNQYACVDIDECAQNKSVCGSGYTCGNTAGSYTCTDIDECSAGLSNYGACNNTVGSFTYNPYPFYIVSSLNRLVLGPQGNASTQGTPVTMQELVKGKASQIWTFTSDMFIQNSESGQVIDIDKGVAFPGASVILWYKKPDEYAANQHWKYNFDTSIITSQDGNACLDIFHADTNAGATLCVYTPKTSSDNSNQVFRLIRADVL